MALVSERSFGRVNGSRATANQKLRAQTESAATPVYHSQMRQWGRVGRVGHNFFAFEIKGLERWGKRGKSRLRALFAKPAGELAAELNAGILARRRRADADHHPLPPPKVGGTGGRTNRFSPRPPRGFYLALRT